MVVENAAAAAAVEEEQGQEMDSSSNTTTTVATATATTTTAGAVVPTPASAVTRKWWLERCGSQDSDAMSKFGDLTPPRLDIPPCEVPLSPPPQPLLSTDTSCNP
ncbi:unnamed protein product, partial [Laminaria digitata]